MADLETMADFEGLNLSNHDKKNLKDAYQAVTKAEAWEWLTNASTPGSSGFMFCTDPIINNIVLHMEVQHSGASFVVCMRHLETIAKKGWPAYIKMMTD